MLLEIGLIIIGLILLVKGSDFLVDSATRLAVAAGLSVTVIGLTVVAFGTSLPEFIVGVSSSLEGQGQVALGDVIGANIANICLIIGIGAIIRPVTSVRGPAHRDMLATLGIIILLILLSLDGTLGLFDGAILLVVAAIYCFYVFSYRKRMEEKAEVIEPTMEKARFNVMDLPLLALGMIMALAGGVLVVDSAVMIATEAGISPFLIGVVVIALGTTLPELSTAIVASRKGRGDLVLGNSVGSVCINSTLILGACALISPITPARPFDFTLVAASCVVLLVLALQKNTLSRKEGVILLGFYVAYILLKIILI